MSDGLDTPDPPPAAGPAAPVPDAGGAPEVAPDDAASAVAARAARAKRDRVAEVLIALSQGPERFSFYHLLRALEAVHPDRPRFGRAPHPDSDPLRLAQEPTVTHPSAALAAFEAGDSETPHRLLVHFFGLFGTDGPLPLHLTEYARERRRNYNDPTFQRFADIFHHRAISLFYRAWADVRPTVAFDRPDQDRFADYVGSFIGVGMDVFRDRDAMPHLTKLHFAGLLAGQTRHAEGLAQMLTAFFDVPVRLEEFQGAWMDFPDDDRSRLGAEPRTGELGRTIVLGAKVWSRQHKFRIVFGPLSLQDYRRLLPGGLSFHRLVPIVRNYAGDVMIWDVNLVLKASDVPQVCLGRQGQLGWTTWLSPRTSKADAADLFLDASADSHASQVDHDAFQ